MLKHVCVILHLGPTMLPKAFVVLAINALLAETYIFPATDHHKFIMSLSGVAIGGQRRVNAPHWCAISSDYMKSFI